MQTDSRYDDEISLIELWNMATRRKWYVIMVTVICVAIAAAYVFTQKKVYSSKVDIALAGIVPAPLRGTTRRLFIVSPDVLTRRLQAERNTVQGERVAWVEGVDISNKRNRNAGVITLTVDGDSPQRAHGFAKKLATELVTRQNAAIEQRRHQLASYRQGLETDLKSARRLLAQLQHGQRSNTLRARAALIQSSADLQSKIDVVNQQSSDAYLRNAEILSGPSMNTTPTKPKTKLILVLGLVGGLLLGLLLSVFVEFLARARAV